MTLEALEAAARKLNAELPRFELLVRILVPKGGCERLQALFPQAAARAMPCLYGIPIVEDPGMAADATPLGEFADGSIRPLSPAPEEGATSWTCEACGTQWEQMPAVGFGGCPRCHEKPC